MTSLYATHIEHLQALYGTALTANNCDAVLLHSGSEQHYFADDRGVPFQAFGHFCHWLPVNRPDQFLLIGAEQRPIYYQLVADDFWYDQSIASESWWTEQFEIIRLTSLEQLAGLLPETAIAYLGESPALATKLGIEKSAINPASLVHFLDFQRAVKTDYELQQLRAANRLALTGHRAAHEAFIAGGSEYAIHMAYLQACQVLENDSPYTNIVALDEKAAILHYQHKRTASGTRSQVLLIDAGARVNGYCSDITRTSIKSEVPALFADLLTGMDTLQQQIVAMVCPGLDYGQLHDRALQGVAELLVELGICRGTTEALMAEQIPQLFMPHGVGHLLGIQVHDVGGQQADAAGHRNPPPDHAPALRTTRTLEADMVFTIEPGCYFIPLLLEPERDSSRGKCINWNLIDQLYPCGGIRVEDNIRVSRSSAENMTREALNN